MLEEGIDQVLDEVMEALDVALGEVEEALDEALGEAPGEVMEEAMEEAKYWCWPSTAHHQVSGEIGSPLTACPKDWTQTVHHPTNRPPHRSSALCCRASRTVGLGAFCPLPIFAMSAEVVRLEQYALRSDDGHSNQLLEHQVHHLVAHLHAGPAGAMEVGIVM